MNRETPGVGSAGHRTQRENVSRIRWRDDEQRNTRRWKRRAQNTIDSPGLRRALNGRLDTEQDNTAANMRQKGKMRKE